MDYYLAYPQWLPPGRFDRHFTEKLVYLPTGWPFEPHPGSPLVGPLPALESGIVTFGSFNKIGKVNASSIALWSELLRALPTARMLIAGIPDKNRINPLIDQFARHGIAGERFTFHLRYGMEQYLALHAEVDLCLDTAPYTGGTTTNHALWMGVPTLTIAGSTPPGRQGAANMGELGLDSFIAADTADFLAKGQYWATHLNELAAVRAGLRRRCEAAPRQQPAVLPDALERALRHMWRLWCTELPAESFEISLQSRDLVGSRPSNETGTAPCLPLATTT
jgi:predicted O-linked N-acetylglucosamine transferase (SPINDLY family)